MTYPYALFLLKDSVESCVTEILDAGGPLKLKKSFLKAPWIFLCAKQNQFSVSVIMICQALIAKNIFTKIVHVCTIYAVLGIPVLP